jgi:hypothetical protein
MADLSLTTDLKPVQDLKKELIALGATGSAMVTRLVNENKRMVKALTADAVTIQRANELTFGTIAQKSMTEWGNAQRKRIALMQESERMAQKEIATTIRQRQAEEDLARARAQSYQSNIGGSLGLSSNGTDAAASAAAMSAEMDRLRSKYDSIYASSKRYEASLEELDLAHRMGVFNSQQHAVAVEQLNASFAQTGASGAMVAGRMNQIGVATQQLGYQVGDFFVQIQSGTNWMVAFGQQATQLVGVLPMVADRIGITTAAAVGLSATLGIAIPIVTAIGALWMRSSSSNDAAKASLEEYSKVVQTATSEIASLNQELLALRYPDASDAERFLMAQIEIVNLMQAANRGDTERLLKLKELNGLLEQTREKQKQVAEANSEAARFDEKRRQWVEDVLAGVRKEAAARKAMVDDFVAGLNSVKSILDSINGMQLTVGLQINAAVSGLPEFATGIWDKMGELGKKTKNAYGQYADTRSQADSPTWAGFKSTEVSSGGSGGGGGGGGGNARLESLISELQTEEETLAIWYEESQTALQSASDAELTILGGKHEAMLRLTEEYVKKKAGIEEMSNQWSLESAVGGAAEIFGALGAFNKKALKAQAVFAAGAALISTYQGAAKELEKGTFGFATAAAVIAKGIGFVAAIKSAGDGGSGGDRGRGGSPGTSTVAPAAQQPSPQTVYVDSISPESLYSGQTLINLFEAFYNENDKRGKVFVVAR